jgi:hypothetical protein
MLIIALLVTPVFSQPINVGGAYGMSWLEANGDNNVVSNATGLWSWGNEIPIGYILWNGKMISIADQASTVLTYPAFGNTTTLNNQISNRMKGWHSVTNFQNPYSLSEDHWTMAQRTNQPILS